MFGLESGPEKKGSLHALCWELVLLARPGLALPMAATLCMRMERMMQRQGLHGQGKRMARHVAPRLK